MSHPAREPFKQFSKLDPQARLDEFHKRFDRLKSEFQNSQRPMFESANRPFFANQQPSWAAGQSDNAHPANGHVPVEKSIPIQVQHERSRSEPMDNSCSANQPGSSPNSSANDRMHFMPNNTYFQHKFQQPSASSEAANEAGAEPRVHHIPIQVESRHSTGAPAARPAQVNQQQHNLGSVPSQNATNQANASHPFHTAATTSSFSDAKPTRVLDVPIQITKSSSTPETSQKCENILQQSSSAVNPSAPQAANINVSTSDPAIADPNIVYAMGYEPLPNNNQADKSTGDEAKKETPFDYVKEILDDLKNYESQVHEFNGTTPDDKGYRYLDEMLTLCILRLDCINIDGNDELRKYRKSAINEVNRVAAILEVKVSQKKSATSKPQNDSQNSDQNDTAAMVQNDTEASPEEPKDKKKTEKASKAKKEKSKKEPSEKKEGRRIILFRGKNKNKTSAPETNDPASMDVDPNNNDLKDDSNNQSTSDQSSDVASTSSGATLQGKETAV